MRVDPNRLPSGTGVYFLVIAISSVMVAFWSGQFLPGPDYFLTPFAAQFQPGLYSVANGFYGLVVLAASTVVFCFLQPRRQRRAFGPANPVEPMHPARMKIQRLADVMEVRVGHYLSDRNINNADAISFGLRRGRTLLLGKRLLLMSAMRPSAFLARAAHELGHFKNGDVKYVMMSRALIQANLLLMAIVLIWLLFHPARVVLAQYYRFTAPVPGLPGASPELFFKLHATRWAWYWLDQVVGGLALTAPIFLFWTALLFLEYRSLLRTRELLADAQAVTAVGTQPLLDTLTGQTEADSPTLRQRLYELLSPHPLVAKRVLAVNQPERILRPGLLRFLFLGYLWSLTSSLAATIDTAISILNPDYGRIRNNGDALASVVSVLQFESMPASILYVSMFAVLWASYFLVVVALLRSAISERLEGLSSPRWFIKAATHTLCVGLGAVIGAGIRPYGQAMQASLSSNVMLGKKLSGIMFHSIGRAVVFEQAGPCIVFFVTGLVFWMAFGWILNGKRVRPIFVFEWLLLATFTFMFVYQTYAVIWLGWMFPSHRDIAFYAGGFASSSFLLLLTVIMILRIRGGFGGNPTATLTPPWLLAPIRTGIT